VKEPNMFHNPQLWNWENHS